MERPNDPIHFFRSFNAQIKANFANKGFRKPGQKANLLPKFQRAWDAINLDYQTESNRHVSHTDIVKSLETMVDILVKEHAVTDGGVEPGGCTELFLNDDMMAQLVKISENDVPVGFRGEVIRFLNHLISVLDAKLMIQIAIHRPTLTLIRWSLSDKDRKYEDEMVELEYDIASKIREYPHLLYIFFSRTHIPKNVSMESVVAGQAFTSGNSSPRISTSKRPEDGQPSKNQAAGYEFILFDHLLRYVHLEGHRGDIARESCLLLIELATGDLADYINNSDIASVAIAGLGGLYSQLPVRIPRGVAWGESFRFAVNASSLVASIGNSGNAKRRSPMDIFRSDMESFLRSLGFVQMVVLKCPSYSITASMLGDLKGTFLDNIVQSSLTSASDFDGTTVAALYYILQMVEFIKEDQLSAIFCKFLLGGDEEVENHAEGGDQPGSSNENDDETDSNPSELRLHLRDILISKLNSLSEEVVTATLNLFQSMLSHHSIHSLPLLIELLSSRHLEHSGKIAREDLASEQGPSGQKAVDIIATDVHDHL
ncbi:hypothetical protein HDU76_004059, partial [Blyttiomyces sp. JEL0837]